MFTGLCTHATGPAETDPFCSISNDIKKILIELVNNACEQIMPYIFHCSVFQFQS